MNECRLCSGQTTPVWRRRILGKHDVGYFECSGCGSLQTETPYWLDEAYSEAGIGFDTGACQRSVDQALQMAAALEILGATRDTPCLDYGAGIGLYARLMRDRGWNYRAHDKYVYPFYMDKFQADPAERRWGIVSAFEVFEHLPNPADGLEAIIGSAEDYVFFTTELWQRQGSAWDYLSPVHGQHVFFYTRNALELVGGRYGYEFHELGFVKCLAKPKLRDSVARLRDPSFGQYVYQSFLRHQQNPYLFAGKDSLALMQSAAAGV